MYLTGLNLPLALKMGVPEKHHSLQQRNQLLCARQPQNHQLVKTRYVLESVEIRISARKTNIARKTASSIALSLMA